MATHIDLKSVAYLNQIIQFATQLLGVEFRSTGLHSYRAHCPFHADRQDSFRVYVNGKGIVRFYCFGACSNEWDIYDLIQMRKGCSFREAQQVFSRYVGFDHFQAYHGRHFSPAAEKPQEPIVEAKPVELDREVLEALSCAATYYHEHLADNEEKYAAVFKYLARRGVDEGLMERFRIGYAPSFNDEKHEGRALLLAHLDTFTNDYLAFHNYTRAGLIRHLDEDGSPYQRYVDPRAEWGIFGAYADYFAGRMTFPIHSINGQVEGFIGRRIDNRGRIRWVKQKTENTSISTRGWLYGIDKAYRHIAYYQTVIIVEGIFDYFAFYNILQDQDRPIVVSTLGSNLTDEVKNLLMELGVKKFIIAYDWDVAGRNALEDIAGKVEGTVYYLGGMAEGEDPADKLKLASPFINGFSLAHLMKSAAKYQAQTEKPILIEHLAVGKAAQPVVMAPASTLEKQAAKTPQTPKYCFFNAEDFLPLLRYDHGNKAALNASIEQLAGLLANPTEENADAQQFRIKGHFLTQQFYQDLGPALILWLRIMIEQQAKKRFVRQTDATLAEWLQTSRKTVSKYKNQLKDLGLLNIDTSTKTQKLSVSLAIRQ